MAPRNAVRSDHDVVHVRRVAGVPDVRTGRVLGQWAGDTLHPDQGSLAAAVRRRRQHDRVAVAGIDAPRAVAGDVLAGEDRRIVERSGAPRRGDRGHDPEHGHPEQDAQQRDDEEPTSADERTGRGGRHQRWSSDLGGSPNSGAAPIIRANAARVHDPLVRPDANRPETAREQQGVVGDTGLEPVTSCMSSKCSNQLS